MDSAAGDALEEPFESAALDAARDAARNEIPELEEPLESAPAESAFIEHVRSIDVAWDDTGLARGDEEASIDLSTFVEKLSADSRHPRRPRKRREQPRSRRKIQRVYDEDAYFDPDRVAFSALVATLDEFTQGA
jgi:hypothetical protein